MRLEVRRYRDGSAHNLFLVIDAGVILRLSRARGWRESWDI
jgi:hypothetical protein